MGEQMPKEQYNFIYEISEHMKQASNMTENESWSFAFRVWQFKDYLKIILTRTLNDDKKSV